MRLMKYKKGISSSPPRKSLIYTPKIILVAGVSIFLFCSLTYLSFLIFRLISNNVGISLLFSCTVMFLLFKYFYFLYIAAILILLPIDTIVKESILLLAKLKIRRYKNVKIIGIVGSFGKTTTKEVIYTILTQKYNVLKTPQTINTPLGIARLILTKLSKNTEILLVEMGEFYKGDIIKICSIVQPDISVITGINEAHFERLKNLDNTVNTIFEIVGEMKKNGMLILNADNALVMENYNKYTEGGEILFYSSTNKPTVSYQIKRNEFRTDGSGRIFDFYKGRKQIGLFETKLLGEYAIGTIMAGMIIGKQLSLSDHQIKNGIEEIVPVAHRLEPIRNEITGILVIDDSYNGNPDGAEEAIKVLSHFKNRRKIYITPGLVETGSKVDEIHETIGKNLGKVADLVILIKNSATYHIDKGLKAVHFPSQNIIWFNSALEAHACLSSLLQTGDVILFQNDWSDNYI